MKIVIHTPAGSEIGITGLSDDIYDLPVTDFYEKLVLELLPEVGLNLSNLTQKAYVSHAFWFTIRKYGKEHLGDGAETKLFLNANDSVWNTLAFMFRISPTNKKIKRGKDLHMNLMTNEENLCLLTDEGLKCLDIPTCSFVVNLEEAQKCVSRVFFAQRLPGLQIEKDDMHYVLRSDTPYVWANFVPWTDANRHRHLFYQTDRTLQETLTLEPGFEWEGNVVVDKRQCFLKCKPRKDGGARK